MIHIITTEFETVKLHWCTVGLYIDIPIISIILYIKVTSLSKY